MLNRSTNGSANLTQPAGGWSSVALAQVFDSSTNGTLPSAVPTASLNGTSGPSTGAIVGIAFGAATGLVLLTVAIWSYWRLLKQPVAKEGQVDLNESIELRDVEVTGELPVPHPEMPVPHPEMPVPHPEMPFACSTRHLQELGPHMSVPEMPTVQIG